MRIKRRNRKKKRRMAKLLRKERLQRKQMRAQFQQHSIEELESMIEASYDPVEIRLMKQVINEKKFERWCNVEDVFKYEGKSRFAKSHNYRKPMSKKYDMPKVDWG